ncbi:hypothetical protein DRO59_08780 [Candidatus Bathyarchaeota archaeon]|nr:MAG: hypothetical protein DRO59_08780 [Candidatus Bathyarchaeota archaeon]
MASYYVDATLGDDSNPGTISQPWKTISKVNSSSFSPGDKIYFKRGETWREQLTVSSSGSDGNPITFGAYGTGEKPIIHGGTTIPSDSWSGPNENGVYTYSYSGIIWFVAEDNNLIPHASDATCIDGNWYWDEINQILYYKPTSGTPSDHIVDRVTRPNCINLYNKHHISIQNLNIMLSVDGMIGSAKTHSITDITISNCEISKCRWGIKFEGRNGNNNSNIIILNNNLTNNGESIFLGTYDENNETHKNCSIIGNTIENTGITTGSEYWEEIIHGNMEAIGLQNLNNSDVTNNHIINGAPDGGIVLWTNQNSTSNNNLFKGNYLKNLLGFGIAPGGAYANNTTNNTVAYNIIVNCGQGSSPPYGGLRLNRPQYPSNKIYNNVLVGNDINIYLYSLTDDYIIKNNISFNPVNYHVRRDGEIGNNVLDYNCYYPDGSSKFLLDGSNYSFSDWKTQTGQDSHSKCLDPSFVDPDNGDFHLKAGSPCIDAGVDVGLDRDFDYNPVPWGAGVDIGAFELIIRRITVLSLSYHPLDVRSGKWLDLSGEGNHGTPYGGARPYMVAPGVMGFKFDGVSGYVDCGSSESLNLGNEFTIRLWLYYVESASDWPMLLGKGPDDSYTMQFQHITRRFGFWGRIGGTAIDDLSSFVVPERQLTYIGISYNGSKLSYFMNGLAEDGVDASGSVGSNSNSLLIGRDATRPYYWKGLIAELVITNRAWSQDEVRENMYRSPIYRMLRGLPHSWIYTKVPWKQTQGGIYVP